MFDIFLQLLGQLPRDENDLCLPAAFWVADSDLSVVNVTGGQAQNLPDSHTTPGHKFQDEPVSRIPRSKDDLVYSLFFKDLPLDRLGFLEDLPQHWGIAWILKPLIR